MPDLRENDESNAALGAEGRRFKSCCPDQYLADIIEPSRSDMRPDTPMIRPKDITAPMRAKWRRRAENAQRRIETNKAATIYFVRCECSVGFIKIGFAEKPEDRLLKLRTACPYPLTLLAQIPGSIEDERALHGRFAGARQAGEWFRPTTDLLDYIATLPSPRSICGGG